jgi:hypothetical protein
MIHKKILLSLFFFASFLIVLNGVMAYSFQFPLCNPPIINNSCINYTAVAAITNAPINSVMYWRDGYLYLTNETAIVYNTTHITNITYTNVSYFYNISNGSSVTVIQNITANESIVREWLVAKLNSTFYNMTFYNRTEADGLFAFKSEISEVRNRFVGYVTTADLDTRYGYLLSINSTGINGSVNLSDIADSGFTTTWKVIVIINSIMIVILVIGLVRVLSYQ